MAKQRAPRQALWQDLIDSDPHARLHARKALFVKVEPHFRIRLRDRSGVREGSCQSHNPCFVTGLPKEDSVPSAYQIAVLPHHPSHLREMVQSGIQMEVVRVCLKDPCVLATSRSAPVIDVLRIDAEHVIEIPQQSLIRW